MIKMHPVNERVIRYKKSKKNRPSEVKRPVLDLIGFYLPISCAVKIADSTEAAVTSNGILWMVSPSAHEA